jgi:hypothetical protein
VVRELREDFVDENVGLYILPTETGQPPRAWIGPMIVDEESGMGQPDPTVAGIMWTWSRDLGMWLDPLGSPIPTELGDQVTAHAKALGVDW